ncbi:D-alanyl-D-alanine carboxypeptidase (penicillin-binding protein 5/6) [Roseimicrobium gellanilyticum]|uniref:D-alanyl-D-alanine carboxypeptidase (Penicillin-binding protein 5/6) n=1 Tax=Roseimicrobium gellanilyticum TaxID=748857 RepID=A0A366H6A0_9BACT|nr:D-alanyl-D-alanine carboxypeptidase family protein [Roseimicrobium gellanilyticum]RBP37648.1 D-alanyl-D-alanine carboxypeptidase (penicillin-binding protein 5/6) [Roseimicrobium gellanilyticum]
MHCKTLAAPFAVLLAAFSLASCTSPTPPPQPPRYAPTAYYGGMGDRAVVPASSMGAPSYQYASYAMPAMAQSSPYAPQPTAVAPPSGPMAPPPPAVSSPSNVGTSAPKIMASSYILVDARNGAVLAARNADTVRGVASTQKLLTALVVAEAGDLDKTVRIAASDVQVEPSKLGVKPGEVYTRRQLLYAFLIKSSNDVANVLARDNAGSISAFCAKMNAKARSVGATQSTFRNPHGLTAGGQYSSARDMARIAMAAYRNPIIRDAVKRKYHTFRFASGRTITLENTNEILGRMPECDGMKTGYTVAAGRCLVSTAHSWRKDVLLVQLGTKTKYIWNDGMAMMRWGLSK